jgi:hypothetical protein
VQNAPSGAQLEVIHAFAFPQSPLLAYPQLYRASGTAHRCSYAVSRPEESDMTTNSLKYPCFRRHHPQPCLCLT